MRKTISFLLLALCFVKMVYAQSEERPGWTKNTPKAGNSTYMFLVERGTGSTLAEASSRALARVYQSTMMRIGAGVSWDEINRSLQSGEDWGNISMRYNIPVNKVCEYAEKTNHGYLVMVLCQVAKAGNVYPIWDEFDGCSDIHTYSNGVALGKSIFLPGLGQMGKRRYGSGVLTLLGEVAFIGIGLFGYASASDFDSEISSQQLQIALLTDELSTCDEWNRFYKIREIQQYENGLSELQTGHKQALAISRIGFSAAALLYIWNLYRAYTITPNYKKDKNSLSFNPILIPAGDETATGFGISLNF